MAEYWPILIKAGIAVVACILVGAAISFGVWWWRRRQPATITGGRPRPKPACNEEILFDHLNDNTKNVVQMVHKRSRWIGEHGYDCRISTPGDGTVRYRFSNISAATHFKLRWYGQDE